MFYIVYLSGKSTINAQHQTSLHSGDARLCPHHCQRLTQRAPIGLCTRRQWPDPLYEPYSNGHGYYCKVRVNNREYSTDVPYKSEALARNGAATKAWMICRNFSSNDGMLPGQRSGQCSSNGVVQGLPVPIGTGRRSSRVSGNGYDTVVPNPPTSNRHSGSSYDNSSSDGLSSGGNSPIIIEGGFEQQMQQVTQPMPRAAPRRRQPADSDHYTCFCRRAPVRAYGRCRYCLAESGWA